MTMVIFLSVHSYIHRQCFHFIAKLGIIACRYKAIANNAFVCNGPPAKGTTLRRPWLLSLNVVTVDSMQTRPPSICICICFLFVFVFVFVIVFAMAHQQRGPP